MKNLKWSLLILAVLSLSACDGSTESPTGVITLAAKAAQKSNLKDLKSYLSGKALEQYGNADGLKQLQQMFAPYSSLEFQNEALVKRVRGDQGFGISGDVLRVFSEEVIGVSSEKRQKIYTASVTCTVYRNRIPGICTPSTPPIPGHSGGNPGHCDPDQYPEVQDCLVDNLQ